MRFRLLPGWAGTLCFATPLLAAVFGIVAKAARADGGAARFAQPYHELFRPTGPTDLSLVNDSGSIEVSEIPGKQISVEARYFGGRSAKVQLDRSVAGQLKIVVQYPHWLTAQGLERAGAGRVNLRIGIPQGMLKNLKASGRSPEIRIEGGFQNEFSGERKLVLTTTSSDIIANNTFAGGGTTARNRFGNIELTDHQGAVDGRTSTGFIILKGGRGDVEVATDSSGSIAVTGQRGGTVRARTASGSILLDNPEAVSEVPVTSTGVIRRASSRRELTTPEPTLGDCVGRQL
jgi:hypothetical protein